MSEQTMNAEQSSPRARAIAYLEMRQNQRFGTGKEKSVKTPVVPDKVRRAEPLVETVTAYEKAIDRLGEKGFVGLQQKMQEFRPMAYDGMRAFQWTTRAADYLTTAAILFWPSTKLEMNRNLGAYVSKQGPLSNRLVGAVASFFGKVPDNTAQATFMDKRPFSWARKSFTTEAMTVFGMLRFRPLEKAGELLTKAGLAVVTSDAVAPIVNNILGGGERVEPAKAKPVPFSGAKPQAV